MKENQLVVVCVDDERIILNGLQHQLRHHFAEKFELELCESGQEVIEVFDEYQEEKGFVPQIVISDQIMPRMKGDELFEELGEKYPGTINILLTGQAEKHDVINAVNHGNLFKYIEKPWETEDLVTVLNQAIALFERQKQQEQMMLEGGITKELEEEINKKKEELERQKKEFENKQKEVEEAVIYARQIQNSLNEQTILEQTQIKEVISLNESVSSLSGDLLWSTKTNEELLIVLIDYHEKGLNAATNVLKIGGKLSDHFKVKGFHSEGFKSILKTIIEVVPSIELDPEKLKMLLISIPMKEGAPSFLGIRTGLVVKNAAQYVFQKGDYTSLNAALESDQIELKKVEGDEFFIFTDGITGQYGGDAYERYTVARFISLLEESKESNFESKKELIQNRFAEWKGETPLLDDIRLIGLKL